MARRLILMLLLTCVWPALNGCTAAPSYRAYLAQQVLRGKSKQEVMACAGQPLRETQSDAVTVLTYYQQGEPLQEAPNGPTTSSPAVTHGCRATVLLKEHHVTGVQYEPVPDFATAFDHCEEIFAHCTR